METLSKETTLWKKLLRTTEKIRNYQSRAISKGKAPDITMTQMQIMGCVLFSLEKSGRVRDISEELGITPGGISQQVETLVRLGLLDRKTDAKDRRAVCITLSEDGKALNRRLDDWLTTLFQRLLDGVPEEKCRIFVEVLDKMSRTLEQEKNRMF